MLNVIVQTVIILTIICCHYGYCHYAKCHGARENGTEKQKNVVLKKLRGYILFVERVHSCVDQSGFRSNFRSVFGLDGLIIYLA